MAEYDLSFSRRLALIATEVCTQDLSTLDAKRTALYLGLLAIEIAFKAMLEKAGVPISVITAQSHDLAALAHLLDRCRVLIEVTPGAPKLMPAVRLRAKVLQHNGQAITIGSILQAEAMGASRYPNRIRYGALLRHFPPGVIAATALEVVAFGELHWESLQR